MAAGPKDLFRPYEEKPSAFDLSPAYPNPFNPQTTFTLSLAEPSHVRITVHDMLGRQMALLHNDKLSSRLTHAFTFDGAGLASGTYLLQVQSEQFIETRRLLLLK